MLLLLKKVLIYLICIILLSGVKSKVLEVNIIYLPSSCHDYSVNDDGLKKKQLNELKIKHACSQMLRP